MTWNRTALLAALPVAAVAVIAGIVSFSHIEALGLRTGQTITDARLLPLAVDGLIVAGSVILLAGSWLGWIGVGLGVIGTLYANVMSGLPRGPLAATVAAWPALAQRSLYDHYRPVADALRHGDIVEARKAVGMIVGRDTACLDETGVARAAIESLAESFCDGVIAPLFWLLVLGLPGAWIYKAINTADSPSSASTSPKRRNSASSIGCASSSRTWR